MVWWNVGWGVLVMKFFLGEKFTIWRKLKFRFEKRETKETDIATLFWLVYMYMYLGIHAALISGLSGGCTCTFRLDEMCLSYRVAVRVAVNTSHSLLAPGYITVASQLSGHMRMYYNICIANPLLLVGFLAGVTMIDMHVRHENILCYLTLLYQSGIGLQSVHIAASCVYCPLHWVCMYVSCVIPVRIMCIPRMSDLGLHKGEIVTIVCSSETKVRHTQCTTV